MPAFCSPLNGVTIGAAAPGSQPRLNGTLGSLNQTPRWYWWVGANVVVPPGDTENVSASKIPRTVALPLPSSLVWMSLWYQEMPNGAVGCWITNRSKPVLAGMPCSETTILSFSACGVMVTCPPAFGRQAVMAADEGLSWNENDFAAAGDVAALAGASVAVRPTAAAMAPPAATAAAGEMMRRIEDRMLVMVVASWHVGGFPAAGLVDGPAGRRARFVSRKARQAGRECSARFASFCPCLTVPANVAGRCRYFCAGMR